MDEESKRQIDELEMMSGKTTGIGKIERGECPIGAINAMGCMFCPYGHMLNCHYPLTCDEAECDHYQVENEG